jgi:hypothetical protein
MDKREESVCADMLLDLVSYEALRRHLSPETEAMLEDHLRCCPSCRRRILIFRSILGSENDIRNFG